MFTTSSRKKKTDDSGVSVAPASYFSSVKTFARIESNRNSVARLMHLNCWRVRFFPQILLLLSSIMQVKSYEVASNRAAFLRKVLAGPAAVVAAGLPKASVAAGAESEPSVFFGRYTDPKHPGGLRDISLIPGARIGAYRLAKVQGGGGKGEPASYELPAVIIERPGEDSTIIIDFSVAPKNGPKDFIGVYDRKAGGISFTRDGNLWSKL